MARQYHQQARSKEVTGLLGMTSQVPPNHLCPDYMFYEVAWKQEGRSMLPASWGSFWSFRNRRRVQAPEPKEN